LHPILHYLGMKIEVGDEADEKVKMRVPASARILLRLSGAMKQCKLLPETQQQDDARNQGAVLMSRRALRGHRS